METRPEYPYIESAEMKNGGLNDSSSFFWRIIHNSETLPETVLIAEEPGIPNHPLELFRGETIKTELNIAALNALAIYTVSDSGNGEFVHFFQSKPTVMVPFQLSSEVYTHTWTPSEL